jgi:PIN domain nuclease of toxin-antitoxin system
VKFLLDTNAWIAFLQDGPELSERAAELMESGESRCWVSVASIWEAAIKSGMGKLRLPYDLETDLPRLLEENGFQLLPIEAADAAAVQYLERLHGDPFDRIQVVQCRRRNLRILSRDGIFERYGLRREW